MQQRQLVLAHQRQVVLSQQNQLVPAQQSQVVPAQFPAQHYRVWRDGFVRNLQFKVKIVNKWCVTTQIGCVSGLLLGCVIANIFFKPGCNSLFWAYC